MGQILFQFYLLLRWSTQQIYNCPFQINPQSYRQTHTPTVVQMVGGWGWGAFMEFIPCFCYSTIYYTIYCMRLIEHFGLTNKMALLGACGEIQDGRHIGSVHHQFFKQLVSFAQKLNKFYVLLLKKNHSAASCQCLKLKLHVACKTHVFDQNQLTLPYFLYPTSTLALNQPTSMTLFQPPKDPNIYTLS